MSVTLFTVQGSRSQAAFEALIERWAGILVSDGYGLYRTWRGMFGIRVISSHKHTAKDLGVGPVRARLSPAAM
jgi:hypothetical protein